jgi:hypothetical protein
LNLDGTRRLDRHGACTHRPPPHQAGRDRQENQPPLTATQCHHRPPPASHSETYKKQRHTPTRAPPCATTADADPSAGTPPTSWPFVAGAGR